MGTLLSYSLYSSIVLALLYLAYKWVMAGENQHCLNRVALWGIYGVSLSALPVTVLAAKFAGEGASGAVEVVAELPVILGVADPAGDSGQPVWLTLLLWVYLTGMAVVLAHTLLVGLRLRKVIADGERVATYNSKVVVVTADEGIAPFSWCRYVVMNRRDWDEAGEMILTHELRHLGLGHWVDLLLAQVVGVVEWYNPAAWLMREELKTVHEYQADSAVIASGVCMRDYQMLLIRKAVGARFPSLANSLNHSKLKKRITMMYNQKSSAGRRMRALALVPALGAALAVTNLDAVAAVMSDVASARFTDREIPEVTVSSDAVAELAPQADAVAEVQPVNVVESDALREDKGSEKSEAVQEAAPAPVEQPAAMDDTPDKVYSVVEKKPQFPGGDKELLMYIMQNVRFPESAIKDGKQGVVVVRFVVGADGEVGDVKIVRSVDPALDEESIRVVKSLPKFTPGEMDGKPVAVWYTLPVSFKLSDNADDTPEKGTEGQEGQK
ncbi:MAG: TonB family protein [Bacteroides sp.]|nr:TonB family protein [Bacteroides sp.]